ncbi:PAS domain-containing sensor histidine kinase [Saccharicrinis sp. GN24d3]|uniref:PAS domain-containing sensor histidine kinase n=1 Tax=Saccharicrinis sp. GN24d3 TaxID=3458416 RepID=UPI00403638BA
MQHDNNKSDKFEILRQRAEELIKHQPVGTNADSADMLELIHELKVQQIELELQNEELRQSRQEISDLQLEYENLYEFASCGYITINAKGIITRANLMTVTLLQTERRYLLHSGFSHFIAPGWEGAYHETLKESIKTGEKQRIELPLQINDNRPAWVLAEIEADCDDSGKLHQWRLMLIDITLRKQSEAINIKNKEELDVIYKNAPVLLMLIDKDRRIKKINKYGEKYIGASSHDLIGLRGGEAIRCIHHLDHPKGCGFGPSCVQCPIRNRVMDTFEKGITHEMKEASLPLLINGEEKEATFLISTALLSLKEEPEVMLSIVDITERKRMEKALRESEDRYRSLFNNSTIAVSITSLSGKVLKVNDKMSEISGYSHEELQTVTTDKVYVDYNDRKKLLEIIEQQGKADDFECRIKAKSGKLYWAHMSVKKIIYGGEDALLTSMLNITKLKETEKSLKESEERYRTIFDNAPIGFHIRDLSHRMIDANPASYHMHGYSRDEFLSLDIHQYIGKNLLEKLTQITEKIQEGKSAHVYGTNYRKDGSEFQVEVKVVPIHLYGKRHMLTIIQDITELKKTEENLLRKTKQLQSHTRHLQSVREEERTAIAREIHDEFGQVLAALNMNLSTIEREIKDKNKPVDRQGILTELKESKNVLTTAINDVKKMITELRPQVLDVFGVIPAIQRHLDEFGRRNRVRTDFSSNIDRIDFDKDSNIALFRIVQEVLTNVAKHAKASRVNMVIKKSKKYLTLTISDNGAGFDLNVREQKQSFGLLGMEERVLLLNGELKIKSEAGQGTNIWIKIPLPGKPH